MNYTNLNTMVTGENITMTKCSALYCSNSSTKGFPMFKFPVDKQKRMFWLKKMGRHNWVPGPNDALCCVCITSSVLFQ